jgi:hypothetical protein
VRCCQSPRIESVGGMIPERMRHLLLFLLFIAVQVHGERWT